MPWLQVKIQTSRDQANAIEDALLAAGACSVTLEDNADQPILEPALGETPLWDATRITGLFDAEIDTDIVNSVLAAELGQLPPQLHWEQLEDKDWERAWMDTYKPIRCGDNLWICPSWCEPPAPKAINLMLDPGLAFGTGTHPTTFLCMQWIGEQDWSEKSVMDYGCGSGILGIATLLSNAQSACGVDIDPQALVASRDNLERNKLAQDLMPVYLPEDCPERQYDVVLANILAGPLAELAPALTQLTAPNGKLCLSGILESQAQAVINAYSQDFDFDPIASQDEWVRLTARKK